MGQLGKELYKELDSFEKHALAACLNKIEERKDLEQSAKCLIISRKRHLSNKKEEQDKDDSDTDKSAGWVGNFKFENDNAVTVKPRFRDLMSIGRRKKLNVTKIPRIALLRRNYIHKVRHQSRLEKLKKREKRDARWTKFGDSDNNLNDNIKVRKVASAGGLRSASDKSPVTRVADLISMLAMGNTSTDDMAKNKAVEWKENYDRLLNLKKVFEQKEQEPGAKVYSMRMYDLVLDRKTPSMTPKQSKTPQGLVQMGMTLFNQIGGEKNREMREGTNANVLSPRFAPVMPDKTKSLNMTSSPSILSFYEDNDNKNNIASIPNLLKSVGVEAKDRDVMLGALMKASGANDVVNDAMNFLDGINFFGMKDDVFEVTERVAGVYEELESSFNKRQHDYLEKDGFTFMEDDQYEQLYNNKELNLPEEAKTINNFKNRTYEEKKEALWLTVEQIASGKSQAEEPVTKNHTIAGRFSRHKRFTLISVLSPVILAPYMFAPIFGLGVLGPVILSPNIFSPLILNPSVLSPYILSPAVAMPFILSPYLLGPYILSPLVMAPFILNPYVLSPNVVNPYVLSPLVLSPLVLCPDVVSPMTLGGAVLSPSVASPAVLTETFLMATVLSPSFLS
ncbi:unnamed protein product [Bursaphelenchus okinawaensis]|uniref:Uncharacterized protein n=1 Tax=Bursaphelenchus okinawaensis TaxID=465554 RepID=A0A811K229_9BILA|nr:unnamed protein product [Bursaphelenchus okinawaensis]CAG9089385.1 unnamed protein product [Bursaphelenchus okinawaensis]